MYTFDNSVWVFMNFGFGVDLGIWVLEELKLYEFCLFISYVK